MRKEIFLQENYDEIYRGMLFYMLYVLHILHPISFNHHVYNFW